MPPTLDEEVTFISGLNPDGALAYYSYAAWNSGTNPADYSGGYTLAIKWGGDTAGTPGGAISYCFDPTWTSVEKQTFRAGLAMWSAVANISFYETDDPVTTQILFTRGADRKAFTFPEAVTPVPADVALTDGKKLLQFSRATISIDTSLAGFGPITSSLSAYGGYPWMTVLHELGHAIGLGHAGPYNTTATASQQFSPYDTRLWSMMSYLNNSASNQYAPTDTTNWNGNYPTTPMIADILAAQRLYGLPTSTPLSGGQVFGFNTNITGPLAALYDFSFGHNHSPVVTLWDAGDNNTLDLSGFANSTVNLNPGTFSSTAGLINNIAIAYGTRIDTVAVGGGTNTIIGNNNGNTIITGGDDTVIAGSGNDTISLKAGFDTVDGGGGIDTATFGANFYGYSIVQNANGSVSVTGLTKATYFLKATLSNVEFLSFADQTVPATYHFDNSGDDVFFATSWDDVIDGGPGIDTLNFANTPVYYGGVLYGGVTVDLGTTDTQGTGSGFDKISNIEILIGTTFPDFLRGDRNTVAIYSGGGNDTIRYSGGGALLDGGDGYDTLAWNQSDATADISLTFAPQETGAHTLPDGTIYKNIEHFDLKSGSGNDTVTFNGLHPVSFYLVDDAFDGGSGTDTAIVNMSTFADPVTAYPWINGINFNLIYYRVSTSAGDGTSLRLYNVENINLAGGTGADDLLGYTGDDVMAGDGGNDILGGGEGGDMLTGGTGDDVLNGGANVDTAVFAGAFSSYTVTQISSGTFTINGPDGADSLAGIEYAQFDDQTVRLLPGSGIALAPGAAPSSYMAAIRDFEGNNLAGQGTQVIDPGTGGLVSGGAWDGVSGWTLAGSADVSGSGATAQILFNNLIGRWAEVTTQADGTVYFDNHGWAGDTRIVGIYTDPEVALGHAVQGGPDDSQRRFQNDLFIGNIQSVLDAGDYNHDGFQEVYFSLTDGTAYLHALMWTDGNIQYANYQSEQQVQDYLAANGVAPATWSSWLHEEPLVVASGGAMTPPLIGPERPFLAA